MPHALRAAAGRGAAREVADLAAEEGHGVVVREGHDHVVVPGDARILNAAHEPRPDAELLTSLTLTLTRAELHTHGV